MNMLSCWKSLGCNMTGDIFSNPARNDSLTMPPLRGWRLFKYGFLQGCHAYGVQSLRISSDGRQFFVGLGDDGEGAFVGVEHRIQSLRFAERVAHERGS